MNKSKLFALTLSCIVFSNTAIAGLFRLTHHSRANCVNNESISWDKSTGHSLWVSSQHKSFRFPGFGQFETLLSDHRLTGGEMKYYPAGTYDGAKAIHVGEGALLNDGFIFEWEVKDIHKYPVEQDFSDIDTVITKTRDCDIIQGWL